MTDVAAASPRSRAASSAVAFFGSIADRLPVPPLSARAMGLFRVVLGSLLFYIVYIDPPRAQPLDLHRNYSWLADWSWVHAIAASDSACRVLHAASLVAIASFTAGAFTRYAYGAAVATILASRLVELQQSGTHDWDLPLFTLFVLLAVRWGDGVSLDRLLRRSPAVDAARPMRRYGLAIWLPGLTIGVAFAAAACAKLVNSGIAWITSGAVRYHFVEDASNAPYTWGLWVAAHPDVAVLLSLGAVALEALFVLNVFARSAWLRFVFGLAGLSLFAGFYVFQGVLWLPWLMLFSAFLPWTLLDRRAPPPGHGSDDMRLRPWHGALVAAIVVQQVYASATATQIEPLISDYPMYSSTFESPQAFERARYRKLQQLFFEVNGADVTPAIREVKNASENLLNAAEHVTRGEAIDDDLLPELAAVRNEYRSRTGRDLTVVTVIAERVLFDWERGEFRPPVRVRLADVPLPEAAAP